MKDEFGLKLIVLAGMHKLKLYAGKGVKVIDQLDDIDLNIDKHHRGKKSESHCHQKCGGSSLFEPHTSAKDIEHNEAARFISSQVDQILLNNQYKEVIIAAEPGMLGFIKQHLSTHVKKLEHREIPKDLLSYDKAKLEKIIFGK